MTANANVSTRWLDRVWSIGIHRPEKRSALDEAMFDALAKALEAPQNDPEAGAVLLHGTADCFCAGHDLAAFETLWPQPADGAVVRLLNALVRQKKALVAAVCGPAVGIGATMLLHADYVVAGQSATFRFPFVDLDIVPEAGATALLARRVGDLCARDWLLSGRTFDAEEALHRGFVSTVEPDADVLPVAARYAMKLADKPDGVVSAIRNLLVEGATRTAEAAILAELNGLNTRIPEVIASQKVSVHRRSEAKQTD